ncbi:MAG: site-specific DNA-methyltransferase [Desulfatirhabdiaceae bacterium]
MVYFDPPYGIKYGSNFQPFVNKRDVKDGKDEDISAEPEMIKAFRDTWELGIHSYLTYLRDRLFLAKELLADSGSCFVQISAENVHHVREIMDEVFGVTNFITEIIYKKTSSKGSMYLDAINDFILYYAKDKKLLKYRTLYYEKKLGEEGASQYVNFESADGITGRITQNNVSDVLNTGYKIFAADNLTSQSSSSTTLYKYSFADQIFSPGKGGWKTNIEGMKNIEKANRLLPIGNTLMYKRYLLDFPVYPIGNLWMDTLMTGFSDPKIYVVQSGTKAIQRCILLSTDPGDIVLDITCGSGTTAYVAEQWGRRWMTCDTSRVALTLAKQRLMTANFDYYKLAHPNEGISSGFEYKTVPHITLKSIANNEPPATETLYDQPFIDNKRTRVTGPFTVEAVPAPYARSFDELEKEDSGSDTSIARTGETLRQSEWRDELLRTGIRGKNGQKIMFSRVEPMAGTKYIQAEAETRWSDAGADTVAEPTTAWRPQKMLVVFGPEHAPLEQRQVELAIEEARWLKPDILLFCAFQFDEEAAKDIDETPERLIGFKLLKAQMNADLFTDDLRKKRSSNESFWLVGQPDVKIHQLKEGKIQVEVMGFDYYNTKTGNVESGSKKNIAMWMLDTDYDGRSLFPRQVFLPLAGEKEGWTKLAKNLRAEIDEEKIEAFAGTISLEFTPGSAIAVKIVDDRGIESLRVMKLRG